MDCALSRGKGTLSLLASFGPGLSAPKGQGEERVSVSMSGSWVE